MNGPATGPVAGPGRVERRRGLPAADRTRAEEDPRRPAGSRSDLRERFPLGVWPTPLTRAHRLEAALGLGPVLVKRDDLAGFAVAGNKTRPLEHLIAAALRGGAEVLVTGGGPGSNFVAAAAVAARAAGLECELVIWGDPEGAPAIELARATGARIRPTGGTERSDVDRLVAERAAEIGARAYPVPRGGSTPVGALGFADAADELAAQLSGRRPAAIVLPVGSGGSCAGLLAGGLDIPVVGVSVSRSPEEIRATVLDLADRCAALRGTAPPRPELLEIVDARGPGFGAASAAETEAALLALRTEGLLLDPTYGAEAFAEVLHRAGAPTRAEPGPDSRTGLAEAPIVWWHTGGVLPAGAWLARQGSIGSPAPAHRAPIPSGRRP
ncbi:D-cysteine desulfhydrase family protein [Pseudonocardia ailaonensis]|uniref:D-cysteine desulfhydrase family protein n=1 Tax=Pseudonocardia ailaonensis TaxID=367279 RepID=A0ABN2MVI4_9PSEU